MKAMKKNNTHHLGTKGFSLPELMIAAAIMGGLSLGYMKLTQNGLEGGKRIESGAQINEIKSEVLGILSNRDACYNTFNPFHNDFTDVIGGGVKSISEIRDKNNYTRFSVGQQFPGGVKLVSINVKDFNSTTNTAGLLLGFDYKLNSSTKMDKIRRFDLQLELNSKNLDKCVALAGVQSIDPKQLCDTVVGFSASGASYFEGSECNFAKATCEKGGGVWDLTKEKCDLGNDQKLAVRDEACKASGGKFVKPVKAWHYKLSGLMDDTKPCTAADMSKPDTCYCKTMWSKFYRMGSVGGAFPHIQNVPLERNHQIGGYFTIPELFPIDVGSNSVTSTDKKRFTRIRMSTKIQYARYNYTHPGVNGNPWLIEQDGTPFALIQFDIHCYSANTIPVAGAPYEWNLKPALTSSGWSWTQGGSSYSTSFSHLGGFGFMGFNFNSSYQTREAVTKRIYAAEANAPTGVVDWRNQYEVEVSTSSLLEPGDKCIFTAKPVFSSDNVSSFDLKFHWLNVKVDQTTNRMDIPQSNGD